VTQPQSDNSYNANVVLTANADQYQQTMQQSTQSTNKLNTALGALTSHLDGITKRAGRRLFQFSATDFAALAAGTATAATFEKQLKTLQATTTVTGQSFGQLKSGIENTFKSFPVSRGEVIELTQSLTQMGITGADSVKTINTLTQTFIKLGAATGEGATQLAQGLTQLSRLMGVQSAEQIGNFAKIGRASCRERV